MTAITRDRRFTRRNPCPICRGGNDDKRGRGVRCTGYYSEDESVAFCSRPDYSGERSPIQTSVEDVYAHLLSGPCPCGAEHGAAPVQLVKRDKAAATPAKVTRAHLHETPTAIYAYRALDTGAPLRKLRYGSGPGKRFVWQRPDVVNGIGGWIDGRDGATADAYGAETLASADHWAPLFITEGEKDRDAVASAGGVAISPPDGAGVGKWRTEYNRHATGRQVVILADNDAAGIPHAEAVSASVARVALSVRVVIFPDAKDVGDWLDAGHTFAELLALAAATPIIAACKPETRATSFTPQDDLSDNGVKSCPNCQRSIERARIAETSLANLRQERALEERYLAIPNEKLSAPVKLAALALGRELSDGYHSEHDEAGRPRIYRAALARRCGVGEKAVSVYLKRLDKAGLYERKEKRTLDDTAVYIGAGPNLPEAIPTPERGNGWGGARKHCRACGSENLETRITCRDCGTVFSSEDTNKPETRATSFTPQDDLSAGGIIPAARVVDEWPLDYAPSAITVGPVGDMRQDGAPALECPECGGHETDGLTHRDGPHCDLCDLPMTPAPSKRPASPQHRPSGRPALPSVRPARPGGRAERWLVG